MMKRMMTLAALTALWVGGLSAAQAETRTVDLVADCAAVWTSFLAPGAEQWYDAETDGMVDAATFKLLERLLENDTPTTYTGGLVQQDVIDAWDQNLLVVQADGYSSTTALGRMLTAYATMGTDSINGINAVLAGVPMATITSPSCDLSVGDGYLMATVDAEGDGTTNTLEYDVVDQVNPALDGNDVAAFGEWYATHALYTIGNPITVSVAGPADFTTSRGLTNAFGAVNADATNGPNAAIRILDSGTYWGEINVGQPGVSLGVASGQAPMIIGDARKGDQRATLVAGVNNADDAVAASLTVLGDSPSNQITIQSNNKADARATDATSTVTAVAYTNVSFQVHPTTTTWALVAASGDQTYTNCTFTANDVAVVLAGHATAAATFIDCDFTASWMAFYPWNGGALPVHEATFTGCSFAAPGMLGAPTELTATFDNCDFNMTTGVGGNMIDIAGGETITIMNARATSGTALDSSVMTGPTPNSIFRVINGQLNLVDCEWSDYFLHSWTNTLASEYMQACTVTLNRCVVESPAHIQVRSAAVDPADPNVDTHVRNIVATNSIFLYDDVVMGALQIINNYNVTDATTYGSVDLQHCTFADDNPTTATGGEIMVGTQDGALNVEYCIFDGQNVGNGNLTWAIPPTTGGNNIAINSRAVPDAGNLTPVATVADPLLDATGHIDSKSPAIDAALGSTLTIDIDGEARPIGAANDIGADERERYNTARAWALFE